MREVSRGEGIHSRALLSPTEEGGVRMENRDWSVPEPGLEALLIPSDSMLLSRTRTVAGLPAREASLSVWLG